MGVAGDTQEDDVDVCFSSSQIRSHKRGGDEEVASVRPSIVLGRRRIFVIRAAGENVKSNPSSVHQPCILLSKPSGSHSEQDVCLQPHINARQDAFSGRGFPVHGSHRFSKGSEQDVVSTVQVGGTRGTFLVQGGTQACAGGSEHRGQKPSDRMVSLPVKLAENELIQPEIIVWEPLLPSLRVRHLSRKLSRNCFLRPALMRKK